MRAGHHIGDELCFGRIRNGRLQHADDSRQTRAQPDRLAEYRWIVLRLRCPKTIGKHTGWGGFRPLLALAEPPPGDPRQPPPLEKLPAPHSRPNPPRLPPPDPMQP